jgi:hypothetical protein
MKQYTKILRFWTYPSSCFYLQQRPVYISKHNVSETGFYLRLQVKLIQLGSIDRASPYLRTPARHTIGYTNQEQHKPSARAKIKY